MKFLFHLTITGILLIFSGCFSTKKDNPDPAFYYWKTAFNFSEEDAQFCNENKIKELYVRFFDLEYNWEFTSLIPVARLQNKTPFPNHFSVVPVIYIDNESLLQVNKNKIEDVARKTWAKINRMHHRYAKTPLREIQFDCDWNESTKELFFYFLKVFRKYSGTTQISSTIRLYQYKYYEKAGVPPVDKGVLMYYNMSDIRDESIDNYIFDHKEGSKYLESAEHYPLMLDVALPIYKQGVEYNAHGEIVRLIQHEKMQEMISSGEARLLDDNRYTVDRSDYYSGHSFFGDAYVEHIIRYEEVSKNDLINAADELSLHFPGARVLFFDLQQTYYKNYPKHFFHELKDRF